MIYKFKKWLIMKLAGDMLVILNSTIIYKYYPIFADTTKNYIIEKNSIIKNDMETPFQIYASAVFELVDGKLQTKAEYKEAYEAIIEEIKKQAETKNQNAVAKEPVMPENTDIKEGEVVV